MSATKTKPAAIEFDFAQFEEDLEAIETTSLPHLQMQGVPNVSSSQLKKLDPDFGWFISKEKAEASGFEPDGNWRAVTIERDGKDDDGKAVTIENPGFISTSPRFCVVMESEIEIQEKVKTQKFPRGIWQHRGLAFESYKPTKWRAEQQKQRGPEENQWCMVTRRIILLVDQDNNPLHNVPLAFSCRGGWGSNMGVEIKDWREALSAKIIEAMIAQGAKISKNSRLSNKATAYGVCHQSLGWRRTDEAYSPSVTVVGWYIPTHKSEMVGKERKETKGGKAPYDFSVIGVPFSEAMVSKNSPAGQLIAQWQEDYADFVDPLRNQQQGEPITLRGRFGGNPKPTSGGAVECLFNTSTGSTYTVILKEEDALIADVSGDIQLEGFERDGVVSVESAKSLAPAVAVQEEIPDIAAEFDGAMPY